MDTHEAIRAMMEGSRISGRALSVAMGKHPNFVSSTLTKGSVPRVDTLARMADVMGYRLVLEGRGERIPIDPPAPEGGEGR